MPNHLVFADESGPLLGSLLMALTSPRGMTSVELKDFIFGSFPREDKSKFHIRRNANFALWNQHTSALARGKRLKMNTGVIGEENNTTWSARLNARYP